MPFVQLEELKVHYEHVGTGEIPIIFVHGNFASWRWWRPVLERLPREVTGYAPMALS